MRTIFMETTKISPEKTIAQIQELLSKHGVKNVMLQYDGFGNISAMSFTLIDSQVPYLLPARHESLIKLAEREKLRYLKSNDEDQARRIAWRQVFRWIEAQIAMIEIGMVEMQEVFLPYMMVDEYRTIFQLYKDNGLKLLKERVNE